MFSVSLRKHISVRDYKSYGEDPTPEQKAASDKAAADKAASDKAAADKTFTQTQVDEMINKRFKKEKEANEKLKTEYEKLQQTQGLSAQQIEEYAKKVQELENAGLSKEELAKKEHERLQKTAKENETKLSGERDLFKNLYSDSQIESAIQRAASDPDIKALRPEQMIMMLKSQTRLIQKDAGGKQQFEVAVDWKEVKDNETIVVQIPVKEALKRMKEQPTVFGNLFESDAKGGLGGQTVSANDGSLNPASYGDFAAYKKNREAILAKTAK